MTSADPRTVFANHLRGAIEDFLSFQHTDADLTRAADLLGEARQLLAGPAAPRYYERTVETNKDRAATFADYLNETPFGGGTHPVSPPGSLTLNVDGSVTGLVTAGRPYEGPARCMHGGFVAGLFDHFLGMAQHAYNQAHGTTVMGATRELTIRYVAPTPLDTELTFHAWLEDVDERTLRGHGTCHAGDVLTATAEGQFVKLGVQRILSTDPDGFNAPRPPSA
jgi:acyl-coenzyme A thioesterase PaaI-like protein